MSEDFLDFRIPWIPGFPDSWIPVFRIPVFSDYRILGLPYSRFPDSQITEFLDYRIPDSQITEFLDFRIPGFPDFLDFFVSPLFFIVFFSLQIIEEACKKKLRKKHFVIWYFLYTKIMSVQLNNEKIIIVDFERVEMTSCIKENKQINCF